MTDQKQWLFSFYDLGNIKDALGREASRMEAPAQDHLVSHKRQINELIEKITAIMTATGRIYKENDLEDEGTISERLLVTLIPFNVNESGDEPYTVIPIGAKWAVVYRETVTRPVGEKLYTQSTHAYRACRRLNLAYWENEADHNPVTEQQLLSIRKMYEELNQPEPEEITSLSFLSAYKLIRQLTTEYHKKQMQEAEPIVKLSIKSDDDDEIL